MRHDLVAVEKCTANKNAGPFHACSVQPFLNRADPARSRRFETHVIFSDSPTSNYTRIQPRFLGNYEQLRAAREQRTLILVVREEQPTLYEKFKSIGTPTREVILRNPRDTQRFTADAAIRSLNYEMSVTRSRVARVRLTTEARHIFAAVLEQPII
jgi:hypothetical protein